MRIPDGRAPRIGAMAHEAAAAAGMAGTARRALRRARHCAQHRPRRSASTRWRSCTGRGTHGGHRGVPTSPRHRRRWGPFFYHSVRVAHPPHRARTPRGSPLRRGRSAASSGQHRGSADRRRAPAGSPSSQRTLLTLRPAIGYFVTGRIRADRSEGLRINVRANRELDALIDDTLQEPRPVSTGNT